MLRKAKLFAAAAIASFALASAPASAHYYISYWADYPGGTLVGYQHFCDNGSLLDSWGTTDGNPFYLFYTGEYC